MRYTRRLPERAETSRLPLWWLGVGTLALLASLAGCGDARDPAADPDAPGPSALASVDAGDTCPRGTRRNGTACAPITIPEFASLDADGSDFACWRGYRRDGSSCTRIVVPQHAALDEQGHDWRCRRGYRRVEQSCERIQVPSHASLDASGNAWECWRGYRANGDACVRVEVPRYARLDPSGHAWTCWRGYRQEGTACKRLAPDAYAEALSTADTPAAPSPRSDGEPSPSGTPLRAAGLCASEYVAGSLRLTGGEASEDALAQGTLGGESGVVLEFEGRAGPDGRIEGVDDQGRACSLVLAPDLGPEPRATDR